jgi:hypothetical protein
MSRISKSHIAVLLAIGAIVPMQSLVSRPGLAETLGNGSALGLAAVAISDSAGPGAGAGAVNGIAIGVQATASKPTTRKSRTSDRLNSTKYTKYEMR